MEQQLSTLRTLNGQPFQLRKLPLPRPIYDEDGQRLPATYANFLVVNGAVLMPGAGSALDEVAASQLRRAFPGRKVEIIDCRALLSGHGGLHCITMNYPEGF
jgi:agmatine/peptidylarginine deiminase